MYRYNNYTDFHDTIISMLIILLVIIFYNNLEKCSYGDVRLSGYKYYGQVQVCFNGIWEAIFDNNDANVGRVICQQLGFTYSG